MKGEIKPQRRQTFASCLAEIHDGTGNELFGQSKTQLGEQK